MNHTTNDESQLINLHEWLICAHAPNLTYPKLKSLLSEFQCLNNLLKQSPSVLERFQLSVATAAALTKPNEHLIEKELVWAEQTDHHLLTLQDPNYPRLLLEIPTPPLVLFVSGSLKYLQSPQLAIVGARQPTPTGVEIAYGFSRELADAGFIITSGLAQGIDAAAHRGALAVSGTTIAVFGCGIDRIYPPAHAKLAEQIQANGALVSEFPLATPPIAANFPRRNRIVSGLTLGTLVVEATTRSGSLITAHFSAEYGREVFAIPGSIHNSRARGCHLLIREGAKLVETSADIIEEFPLLTACNDVDNREVAPQLAAHEYNNDFDSMTQAPILPAADNCSHFSAIDPMAQRQLLKYIGYEPTSVDMIVARSGESVAAVCSRLINLQLSGSIVTVNGGYMRSSKK